MVHFPNVTVVLCCYNCIVAGARLEHWHDVLVTRGLQTLVVMRAHPGRLYSFVTRPSHWDTSRDLLEAAAACLAIQHLHLEGAYWKDNTQGAPAYAMPMDMSVVHLSTCAPEPSRQL